MAILTGMDGSVRYRGVQYKTRAYLCNGRNATRKYDGTTWYVSGIEQFMFTPTVASAGAGLLLGRYRYFVQPVNTRHTTVIGKPIAGLPSFISQEIVCNNESVTVGAIPTTHPTAQVDKWAVYRCKAGAYDPSSVPEGQDFYFVGFVTLGTATMVDNIPDNQLPQSDTLRFNQMPPPPLKNVVNFGDRQFYFGYDPITTGTVSLTTNVITAGTAANNVLTITTTSAHGLSVGQWVMIKSGSGYVEWDGPRMVISVPGASQFTCASWNDGQAYTVATNNTGQIEYLTFSGVTLPDGVKGLWINLPDGQDYRIYGNNSTTTVSLDRPYSTTLSGGAYTIYHKKWEIIATDFMDVEACGPTAYSYRFTREVPGRFGAVAGLTWDNVMLVFTTDDIFEISGKDPDITNVLISPEPLFRGLGAVGPDAVDTVEGEIYFMSKRGPAVIAGGQPPRLIGQTLLTDWLDTLTATDQTLCTVGCEGRYVYFAFPAATTDVENSYVWRFDRYLSEWHKERFIHPAFYFHDDGDNGRPGLYYAQGTRIFQPNQSTFDCTTALYTGTVTAGTTTTLTNSGAAFPTTSGGLVEAYVHMFNAAGVWQASRRITGNTATQVTWSSSGAGGGTVTTPIAGWTYKIGNVWWYWYTRKWQNPATTKRDLTAYILFDNYVLPTAGTIPNVSVTDYRDGTAGSIQKVPITEPQKSYDISGRNNDFQLKVESDDGAAIRAISDDAAIYGAEAGAGAR